MAKIVIINLNDNNNPYKTYEKRCWQRNPTLKFKIFYRVYRVSWYYRS